MRRHLTESQRAMLATEMLPEFEAKAKEKSLKNLKQNKKPSSASIDDIDNGKRRNEKQRSVDEAGKQFGVSGSSVQRAKRIKKAAEDGDK